MSEKLREAAQQLLVAVLGFAYHGKAERWEKAVNAYYAALAEQTVPSDCADSHQPVAWLDQDRNAAYTAAEMDGDSTDGLVPLYAAPPQSCKQEALASMYIALCDAIGYSARSNELQSPEEWAAHLYAKTQKTLTNEEINALFSEALKGDKTAHWLCRAIERAVRGEKE